MPVIEIEALLSGPIEVPALLEEVSRAAAGALGCPLEHCWVRFGEIRSGTYLEGGRVRSSREAAEVSPIVTIRAYRGRSRDAKARCLEAVARAVGSGLGTPAQNVFVEYREMAEGHVFTGGAVR